MVGELIVLVDFTIIFRQHLSEVSSPDLGPIILNHVSIKNCMGPNPNGPLSKLPSSY